MSQQSPKEDIFPVYVGHIAPSIQVCDLRTVFSRFGQVLEVTILSDYGFVKFSQARDAERAIHRLNGFIMDGVALHVDYSQELVDYLQARGTTVQYTDDPAQEKHALGRGSEPPGPPDPQHFGVGRSQSPPQNQRFGERLPPNRGLQRFGRSSSRSPGLRVKRQARRSRSPNGRQFGKRARKQRRFGQPSRSPEGRKFGQPSRSPEGRRFGQTSRSPQGRRFGQPSQSPEGRRFGQPSRSPEGGRFGQTSRSPQGRRFGQRSQSPEGRRFGRPSRSSEGQKFGQPSISPEERRFGQPSRSPEGRRFGQPSRSPEGRRFGQPSRSPEGRRFGQPALRKFGQPDRSNPRRLNSTPLSPEDRHFGGKARSPELKKLGRRQSPDSKKGLQRRKRSRSPDLSDLNERLQLLSRSSRSRSPIQSTSKTWQPLGKIRSKSPIGRNRSRSKTPKESNDLRQFLSRKTADQGTKDIGTKGSGIKIKLGSSKNVKRTVTVTDDPFEKLQKCDVQADENILEHKGPVQELYIGNLFNEVEVSDVERLLEMYGNVLKVTISPSYAIVAIECEKEKAEEAIKNLDWNLWMDNNIRVQFNKKPVMLSKKSKQPANHDKYSHCDRTKDVLQSQESRAPRPRLGKVKSEVIESHLNVKKNSNEEVSREDLSRFELDPEKRARTFFISSQVIPKAFVSDMKDIFSPFGEIGYCVGNADGQSATLELISNEGKALKCIKEVNSITYKGSQLRVTFHAGSLEDSEAYRKRFSLYFRNYPTDVKPSSIPTSSVTSSTLTSGTSRNELPIGVLPPSSSLGAFGATPDSSTLTSIIENVRASMGLAQRLKNDSSLTSQKPVGPPTPELRSDPDYVSSVEAQIHSVHNKIVVISFFTGFSFQFAKLVPGQMYVNGKKSLGYLIKNNNFHTWPQTIKAFLHQGAKLKMDARKMTLDEVEEVRNLTSENIEYYTPLVWEDKKPSDEDTTISLINQKNRVMRGIVIKLFAKWGVLRHPKMGDIFFDVSTFFESNKRLSQDDSLLTKIALGDLLATQCHSVDYLEMTEYVRELPLFTGTTDSLRYRANLVWNLTKDVDPYSLKVGSDEEEEISCQFLNTSTTLNSQLPSEKETNHRGWPGIVEELHLPAGGVILLDESLGLDLEQRRVYFHRSRLYLNGAKIQSNNSLDEHLVPGDPVTADVIVNLNPGSIQPPYVYSCAFWVALAVQVNTRGRGEMLAQKLRAEEASYNHEERNFPGRIVQLHKPTDLFNSVIAGVAVIDAGPFAGQRVEFDREQCHAFGHSLANADLSYIIKPNEKVFIQVKRYNSFCVDALWIGFKAPNPNNEQHAEEQEQFATYLKESLMDFSFFTSVARGRTVPRPYLPFPAQTFGGKIQKLNNLPGQGITSVEVDVNVGDYSPLKVEIWREDFYIYGHWLGKADLGYILEREEHVSLEYSPALLHHNDNSSLPRASLGWIGSEGDRPSYQGSTSRLTITSTMDTMLWSFVKAKGMDEKTFRALVEGRLPPKESVQEVSLPLPDGTEIALDKETLAQAALLKQMKDSFGGEACMEALMVLVSQSKKAKKDSNELQTLETIQKLKEQLSSLEPK
ncbi:uncharacterized protein LOC131893015 [Tigriopus californicus]|uniref:uncharacterized protein LOC131893015 n=1 Tax=Tigriopus californicus TaxID=6832 RepID=UPI0027D9E53D|nr:uncharacterized protein LOC131893015 [Tigriopus californicus]XP_059098907.1 uncharacterized protein LOC131893015 [Tigriopus californicus]